MRELEQELQTPVLLLENKDPAPEVILCLTLFSYLDGQIQVAVVAADKTQTASWSLPSRSLHSGWDGDLHAAVMRMRHESTGFINGFTLQTGCYAPQTKRTEHRIYLSYLGFCRPDETAHPGVHADQALKWQPVSSLTAKGALLKEQVEALELSRKHLHFLAEATPTPFLLLHAHFSLSELQALFETLLERSLDRSAFRRRFQEPELLLKVEGAQRFGSNRPAQLYRAKPEAENHRFARLLLPTESESTL